MLEVKYTYEWGGKEIGPNVDLAVDAQTPREAIVEVGKNFIPRGAQLTEAAVRLGREWVYQAVPEISW